MRIAKYISNSGYCSRREAEKLIFNKKVKINSIICDNPATKVSKNDNISINKKKIILKKKLRLWIFNKPVGIITTTRDPYGRKNIFDLLPKSLPRIIAIGRLDINSEGLILLTNNGNFSRYLELPSTKLERVYKVRVRGKVNKINLLKLKNGITINKINYKAINAKLEKQMTSNAWITMSLYEGKNREIRKICSYFGWEVNKLIRIKYGDFHIGNLRSGQIKEIINHNYNDKNYWR